MNRTTDVLVQGYLSDVDHALADLPSHERADIVAGLREHIAAALAAEDAPAVRDVLDRLGTPEEIAAEARADLDPVAPAPPAPPAPPAQRNHTHEYFAVGLISAGSIFLPIAGWVCGIVLVWASKVWRVREKLLATFLAPFGFYALMQWFRWNTWTTDDDCVISSIPGGVQQTCSAVSQRGDWAAVLFWAGAVVLAVGPFVTMLVLFRRLRTSEL